MRTPLVFAVVGIWVVIEIALYKSSPVAFIVMIFVLLLFVILYIMEGVSKRCKGCKKWFALKELKPHRSVLASYMGTKSEKKTDIIKDKNDFKILSVERDETVPVAYKDVRHVYQCKYCGKTEPRVRKETS